MVHFSVTYFEVLHLSVLLFLQNLHQFSSIVKCGLIWSHQKWFQKMQVNKEMQNWLEEYSESEKESSTISYVMSN